MTRQKLENWRYTEIELKRISDQLGELEGRALPKSPDWSGKGRSASPSILLDRLVPDIIEQQRKLGEKRSRLLSELREIEEFVERITDKQAKMIIIFRCHDRLTWWEIADRIGGKNTADNCKKRYYRFISAYLE